MGTRYHHPTYIFGAMKDAKKKYYKCKTIVIKNFIQSCTQTPEKITKLSKHLMDKKSIKN